MGASDSTTDAALTRGETTWPRRAVWLVGAAATLAAALVVVSTHRAIEVDEDSISYLTGAESIAHGHGYLNFDGRALTTWPPGLSALLALGDRLGIAPTTFALALNALCASAITILAYALVRRHTTDGRLPVIACGFVAISPVLIRVEDVLASEPSFITLSLAFLVVHEDALAHDRWWPVAASGVVAGAAVLVRWHGVALVAAGVVALMASAPLSVRRRVTRSALFAIVAACLVVPWVVRNVDQGGRAFGVRSGETLGASGTFRDIALAVGRVFVPEQFPATVLWLVTLGASGLVIAGTFTWWRMESDVGRRSATRPLTTVATTALFLVLFAVGARLDGGTDLTLRTLSPAYVPTLVLGFAWFDRARSSSSGALRGAAKVVAAVFVVGAALTVPRAALLVRDNEETVEGFSADRWERSQLVAAVDALPRDAIVFSNRPWPIWYRDHSRRPRLTASTIGGLAQPIASTSELLAAACRRGARLAVFGADVDPREVLPADSSDVIDLTEPRRVDDGVLFHVVPVDRSDCTTG